jgi:hypothetical protein
LLDDINVSIRKESVERQIKLPFVGRDLLEGSGFKEEIERLKEKAKTADDPFEKLLEESKVANILFEPLKFVEVDRKEALVWYKRIIHQSIKKGYKLNATKLKNVYVNPKGETSENGNSRLLRINLELEEGGLRIMKVKEKNGKEIEEIIFE